MSRRIRSQMKALAITEEVSLAQRPFMDNEADMEDEEVALIVVAESEEICDEALKLLKVEWEVLPHILDPREGSKPGVPVIPPNLDGKGNSQFANIADGDIET